jgi:hypothetical protein
MTLSKSIVLIVVVAVGLAAGTLLVAGYADKPQTPVPTGCSMKHGDCPLPAGEACCKTEPPAGCCGAKACADAEAEKSCPSQSAACCPQEAAQTPEAQSGSGGCPMAGCPHAQ